MNRCGQILPSLLTAGVLCPVLSAAAAQNDWTGRSGAHWSAVMNWSQVRLPAAGSALVFPAGASNHTNWNDLPGGGPLMASIAFEAGDYRVAGNRLATRRLADHTDTSPGVTLDAAVWFAADARLTVSKPTGYLTCQSLVQLNGPLTADLAGGALLAGGVTGTGPLTKTGEGRLELAGNLDYAGDTLIEQGRLRLPAASVLGAGTKIRVAPGGALELDGPGGSIAAAIELAGHGPDGQGALRICGDRELEAPLVVAADATVRVEAGTLRVPNGITALGTGSPWLIQRGHGKLQMAGAASVVRTGLQVASGQFDVALPGSTPTVSTVFHGELVVGDPDSPETEATLAISDEPFPRWPRNVIPDTASITIHRGGALTLWIAEQGVGSVLTLAGGRLVAFADLSSRLRPSLPATLRLLGPHPSVVVGRMGVPSECRLTGEPGAALLLDAAWEGSCLRFESGLVALGVNGSLQVESIAIGTDDLLSPAELRLGGNAQISSAARLEVRPSGTLSLRNYSNTVAELRLDRGCVSLGTLTCTNLLIEGSAKVLQDIATASQRRLRVTGNVDLGSQARLEVTFRAVPTVGALCTLIDNLGSGSISGRFVNLPDRGTYTNEWGIHRAHYDGGNGNDLVLETLVSGNPANLPPPLEIRRVSGASEVVLSWPAVAAGFIPESSLNLGPEASWSVLEGTPQPVGDHLELSTGTTGLHQFFRLRRP